MVGDLEGALITLDALEAAQIAARHGHGAQSSGVDSLPSPPTEGATQITPMSASAARVVVPVPISPTVLAASLIAADEPGISELLFLRQTVTVPAGGSTTMTIRVATGYAMIVTQPTRVDVSQYSSLVTATLIVDGVNVLLNNFPFTIPAKEIMPEYGVIRNTIAATFQNGTTAEIEATYDTAAVVVTNDEYNLVISPFLRYGANSIRGIVAQAGGTA